MMKKTVLSIIPAMKKAPLRKAVYKIDKKGKKLKLSQQVGTNTPLFSKSMKYYMNKFSNLNTPMLVTLNDNSGKTLKTLITNDGLKQTLSGYAVPQKKSSSLSKPQMA